MNAVQRAQVLSHAKAFAAIPRADLAVLAEMMRVESFPAGAVVVEAGEAADSVFVVAEGSLSVYLPNSAQRVRELREGDVLGEYGMLDHAVRTATVKADVPSVLLSLDYGRFREYLVRFPDALWVLFESTARRLLEAERRGSSSS
jgi:CRP-like cAMP-binding protein